MLLDIAESQKEKLSPENKRSLDRLIEIKTEIDAIKKQEIRSFVQSVDDFLLSLKKSGDGSGYEQWLHNCALLE